MDQTTSTSQLVSFTAQDLTLATKLFVPPITDCWVRRPRLVENINAGLNRKLTLITAPAGSGKTALLSEWLTFIPENEHPPIAWFSLDEADNDWSRFLAHLIAALQTVEKSIGQAALFSLQAPPTYSGQLLMTALINEISTLPYQFVLILDDYHTITSDKIHDSLAFLLDNLPPQLHIILTSRTESQLPLARLRANRALTEINATDLNFTLEEITIFLDHALDIHLDSDDVKTLQIRTEGWVAAIQLIGLSLQGKSDPSTLIQQLSGENRHITEYFSQEVLSQQSAQIHDFLLQTAILDRFCAPLAQAVTDDADSAAIINYLLEHNLFLIPLDENRTWFRYHSLFADHLRHQLTSFSDEKRHALYKRASQWCNENSLESEAIYYALQSGNNDYATDLILTNGQNKLNHGELTTLLNWLNAIPEKHLHQNPRLSLLYAWTLEHTCVIDGIETHVINTENALNKGNYSPQEIRAMQGEIAAIRARIQVLDNNYEQAINFSHTALSLIPEDNLELRAAVTFQLALAYNVIDDTQSLRPTLDETLTLSRVCGNFRTLFFSAYFRAQLYQLEGHPQHALDFIRQLEGWANDDNACDLPAYGFIHTAHANLLYDMNDLTAAETHFQKAIQLGERGGEFHILVKAYIGLAYTKFAQNDDEAAHFYLEKASALTEGGPYYDFVRAALAINQNDLQTANHWLSKHNLSLDDLIANPKISYRHIPFVRFLIVRKHFTDAEKLLSALNAWATDHQMPYYTMRYDLRQAIIDHATDNSIRATKTLEPILVWANAENSHRLFLDEPLAIPLLQHAAQSHVLPPQLHQFLEDLLSNFNLSELPTPPASTSLFEDLSSREMDLLPLLAAGLSNKAIAEELYLSAGTVKWHLKSIYRKLDAHSRTQAVAIARDLNLIR